MEFPLLLKKYFVPKKAEQIDSQPFLLFLFLWTSTYYLDLVEHGRSLAEGALALGLALGMIAIPSKKYFPLLILFTLQISLVQKLPIMANHNLIMFFMNFIIAAHLLWPQRITPQVLARSFILCLAVTYFWAGFHKINSDFIFGGSGCASFMLKDLLWGLLNKDFINLVTHSIWPGLLVIVAELLISLLLFCSPLFSIGSLLLLSFHSMIILSGIVDFAYIPLTLLIYAGLIFSGKNPTDKGNRNFSKRISLTFFAAISFSATGFIFPKLIKLKYIHFGQVFFWWFLAAFFAHYLLKNKFQTKREGKLKPPLLIANMVFPTLLLILGSTSYFGLNTTRNFSMFSNLRTEGNEWNHLILPKELRVFPYQDEIYWVQEIDTELMFSFRENPMPRIGIVAFEIQRLYHLWRKRNQWPKHFIVKRDSDGKIADARDFIPESSEISPLVFKLMYFRPIHYGPGAQCMW